MCAGARIELAPRGLHVRANRVRAQEEGARDVLGRVPAGELAEHDALAIREPGRALRQLAAQASLLDVDDLTAGCVAGVCGRVKSVQVSAPDFVVGPS